MASEQVWGPLSLRHVWHRAGTVPTELKACGHSLECRLRNGLDSETSLFGDIATQSPAQDRMGQARATSPPGEAMRSSLWSPPAHSRVKNFDVSRAGDSPVGPVGVQGARWCWALGAEEGLPPFCLPLPPGPAPKQFPDLHNRELSARCPAGKGVTREKEARSREAAPPASPGASGPRRPDRPGPPPDLRAAGLE